ncbi:peptidase [Amorphoplanes nipponensis]|uniref:Peptidase n=1 Tax=Actinoplanes nipponensis TaxID=135950 RepID=A0A919MG27_9ACTN|nr:alpha/beta hydrolase [Actinoplanes nipponensis]GIE48139.1 peptidase [Actinoplanes nipponensis]
MRAQTRPILAAFLTVLAAVTSVATPAYAVRGGAPQWRACAEDATAQCATLTVPVDWARPYGPSVAVALARRPAADPRHRIGTLVVNPGGPGGSGVDFTLESAGFFTPELRRRFDIVGFDPRGVSRSHPIVCTTTVLTAAPPPAIDSARAYDTFVAYNRRLDADCARRTGPLYGHVDTLSVVRDVEALRAALGEETISFYGASYGTLLGQQYAERYPRRIRAMVLDSVMDHTVDTDGFLGGEALTAQDSFDEFVAWCARSTECAVHGRDVRELWAGLLAAARAGTLRDPNDPTSHLSLYELVAVAFGSMYDPQWHALGIFIRDAAAGPGARRPRAAPVDVSEHGFHAAFCDDWSMPVAGYADLRARLDRIAATAPQMPFSPLAITSAYGCLGRPGRVDNPQRALSRARTGPVLLVNARHDPATPHVWARHVAAQLGPAASLLTYEGWGHIVYGRSDCVSGAVDRYMLTVRPPAAGAGCPGVEPKAAGVGSIGPGVGVRRGDRHGPGATQR